MEKLTLLLFLCIKLIEDHVKKNADAMIKMKIVKGIPVVTLQKFNPISTHEVLYMMESVRDMLQ